MDIFISFMDCSSHKMNKTFGIIVVLAKLSGKVCKNEICLKFNLVMATAVTVATISFRLLFNKCCEIAIKNKSNHKIVWFSRIMLA